MKFNISEQDKNSSGIYVIKNLFDNRVYIGSAVNLYNRYIDHRKLLNRNKHHSPHLQNFVNKYGICKLSFELIEFIARESLLKREQYWMDFYKSYKKEKGFNINPTAGSNLGKTFDSEFRAKISRARAGKCNLSQKELDKRSEKMKGNILYKLVKITDEYKKMQSEKAKGSNNGKAKLTEENVIKIWRALKNGIKQSVLARQYGVSRSAIWFIKERKYWRHLQLV